ASPQKRRGGIVSPSQRSAASGRLDSMAFSSLRNRRSQTITGRAQSRRRAKLSSAVAKALEPLERRQMLTAIVQTDQGDYAPGSTAQITTSNNTDPGIDFQSGEMVQFQVLRTAGANVPPGHEPWRVI